jgi:hypothetical protein
VTPPSTAPLGADGALAVAAMFIVGFCAAVANGSIAAIFQATVPPEHQGRVFTLIASVATASLRAIC